VSKINKKINDKLYQNISARAYQPIRANLVTVH